MSDYISQSMINEATYELYQLRYGCAAYRYYQYMEYDWMVKHGYAIDSRNYELVYSGKLDPGTTPEDMYRKFNLDKPADFTGHSMSVSDVVVFNYTNGTRQAFYCDRIGFRKIQWRC